MRRYVTLMLFVIMTTSSCFPQSYGLATILLDDTCDAPCWHAIIPGKTTNKEAQEILGRLPVVESDSIKFRINAYKGFDELSWNFQGGERGTALLVNDKAVAILFIPQEGKAGLSLSQLIEKYDEPEYIFSAFDPNNVDWGALTFFFPEHGVFATYTSRLEKIKYRSFVRSETPISWVVFYDKDNYDLIYESLFVSVSKQAGWSETEIETSFYPWIGYGNITDNYATMHK